MRRGRRRSAGRAPTPTNPWCSLSPTLSLAWGLWPEPRTVAMSTSYSIACNAKLPRAVIVVDLN